MKQYYMETNGAQSGPFTLEELRIKGVTRETLVWSDGFEDWKAAGLAEDLQELFKTVPPPIKRTLPSGLSQSKLEDDKASFFSENKSKILLVSMIFLIVLVVIYSMGDKRKNEVEQRTNENTIVIEEQQKQLQEQQAKIAEQERIEQERAERERQNRIQELTKLIMEGEQKVKMAEKGVNDASAFQFLRSSAQRNDEINAANERLNRCKSDLDTWVEELNRLNAEN